MIYVITLEQKWTDNSTGENKTRIFTSEVEWEKENSGEAVRLAIEDFFEEGYALYEGSQLKVISIQENETELDHEEDETKFTIIRGFQIGNHKTEKERNSFGNWYRPQFYFRTEETEDILKIDPIELKKLLVKVADEGEKKMENKNEDQITEDQITNQILERRQKEFEKKLEEQRFLRETADVIYEKIDDNIYQQVKNLSSREDGFYSANQVIYDLNHVKVLIREPHTQKTIFANFYKYM